MSGDVLELRDPEREARQRAEREALVADGVLDVRSACEFLSIGKSTLYALIGSGALPTVTLGRKRLIPRRALVAFLAEHLDEHAR